MEFAKALGTMVLAGLITAFLVNKYQESRTPKA